MELQGLISNEEAQALAQIRKAKQQRTDPKAAAEAALDRLAAQHQHVMGGKASYEQAYSAVLKSADGAKLYEIARGTAAISDPEALVTSINKIGHRP